MEEWKMKRGNAEYPIGDLAMLQQYSSEGRIAATDYLWNPTLQQWLYAKDVPEIAGKTKGGAQKHGCGLAIAMGLLALMFLIFHLPVVSVVCLLGAVAGVILAAVGK